MEWITTTTPIVTLLLGGVTGYYINYLLQKKAEIESRIFKDKREHYRNLILCLKSLSEKQNSNIDLLRFENSFIWLYAPDNVIFATVQLLEEIKNSGEQSPKVSILVGKLLLEIRRDMGFRKTKLKPEDYTSVTSNEVEIENKKSAKTKAEES